jgi:hypothetical protein
MFSDPSQQTTVCRVIELVSARHLALRLGQTHVGVQRKKSTRIPCRGGAKLCAARTWQAAEFSPAHRQPDRVRISRQRWCGLLLIALIVVPAVRTTQGQETLDEDAIAALLAKGKIVNLPEGEIEITKPLGSFKPWQTPAIRGQGRGRTVLRLKNDLVDERGDPLPLIEIKGTRDKWVSSWDLRDLTIKGDGHVADCLWLTCCAQGSVENVEIRDFHGSAIVGRQWWDSYLRNVHFTLSGDPKRKKAVVWLQLNDPDDKFTNCNNLTFSGCRWEQMSFTALQMDLNTTKVHVDDCKFHGILPTPAICDHVHLNGAYSNTFSTSNFTNCGGNALVLTKSHGNVILGNTIANCKTGAGVVLKGCRGTQLFANSFPPKKDGWEGKNNGGDIVESE